MVMFQTYCAFSENIAEMPSQASGADGVKIAVLRKGRAKLEII